MRFSNRPALAGRHAVFVFLLTILCAACGNGSVQGPASPGVDPTSVAAPSSRPGFDLNVAVIGKGAVTSDPVGIDCGTDCVETYFKDTTVNLTATPAPGFNFTGWSGSGIACPGTGGCAVLMSAAQSMTATFSPISAPNFALHVDRSGSGTVNSSPAGIACGADCDESYTNGTSVTLTATPAAGFLFGGWNGGGCTGSSTCTVAMTAAVTTTAIFTPITFALNVSVSGSGSVTSAPTGISCGTDCTENYNSGTSVTLTATPASEFTFSGWSGGGCSGAGACTVAMTAARATTATFVPSTFALNVTVSGSGSVSSFPSGISCGADCSENYVNGTSVSLTATPASGFSFGGWSGGCTGTGACTLTMSAAKSVTATFNALPTFALNVGVTGSGSVSSAPAGISCGSDCSENYLSGTSVTLTAAPASGSIFSGWGGACAGTGGCSVAMTAARSVTATFTVSSSPKTYQLSWNAVTDPRVTGYKLYYSTSPLGGGVTPASINVGNNTSTTFSPAAVGISSGATVFFGVTAIASGLESPLSNTVSVVIQ